MDLSVIKHLVVIVYCLYLIVPFWYKVHLADKEYKSILEKRRAKSAKEMWKILNKG